MRTDVIYWIGSSKLRKFYFDNDAYGLKEYAFNSDFVANDYTKLMMKQILVYSYWNAIIITRKYYEQNHFRIRKLFKNYLRIIYKLLKLIKLCHAWLNFLAILMITFT